MALTNAEKQKRCRDKRNALAKLGEQQQQGPVELRNRGGLTVQLDPLFEELFGRALGTQQQRRWGQSSIAL